MNFLDAIIFGIVEGITEFLPISSTAHLDFTRVLLGLQSSDFMKSFGITIQLGAILAVVILYKEKLFKSFDYWQRIIISFIPTGLIGFFLYQLIKNFLLGNTFLASVMLIVGGVLILVFEKAYKNKAEIENKKDILDLSTKELLIMGTMQALAVVPGVSRSLSVILTGRALGLSRKVVTEFSFLLAIPTMAAATSYDLYKSGFYFAKEDWQLLSVGFATSFVVAFFVVKWLISYIQNNSFVVFGWYRIIAGILILLFLYFI